MARIRSQRKQLLFLLVKVGFASHSLRIYGLIEGEDFKHLYQYFIVLIDP